MDAEDFIMLGFMAVNVTTINLVSEKSRGVKPKTKFVVGSLLLIGSFIVLYAIIQFIPKVMNADGDLLVRAWQIGTGNLIACSFVLSLTFLSSAAWQSFRRRHDTRHKIG